MPAVGGIPAGVHGREYPGNLTPYVLVTCTVAAMGGLIFGYDIGISGKEHPLSPNLDQLFDFFYYYFFECWWRFLMCYFWFLIGGVTSMDPFLIKFFPSVYRKKHSEKTVDQYCQYDSETLTMFTSSLYLAALVSSIGASTITRKFGRKLSILFGGVLFFVGAILNGFAQAVWMLIVGRILLGLGIGFATQVLCFSVS
jgi:MFS family permease